MNDDDPYDAEYDISVHNRHGAQWVDEPVLERGIIAVLERFDINAADISVAVVSDDHIAQLHQQYLDIPGPTDVLTFDLTEGGASIEGRPAESQTSIEGEIVISADTAERLATERGHAPAAELALYAVHGMLHLVGLDDKNDDDARAMHDMEDEVLTAIGLGPVYGE